MSGRRRAGSEGGSARKRRRQAEPLDAKALEAAARGGGDGTNAIVDLLQLCDADDDATVHSAIHGSKKLMDKKWKRKGKETETAKEKKREKK